MTKIKKIEQAIVPETGWICLEGWGSCLYGTVPTTEKEIQY